MLSLLLFCFDRIRLKASNIVYENINRLIHIEYIKLAVFGLLLGVFTPYRRPNDSICLFLIR